MFVAFLFYFDIYLGNGLFTPPIPIILDKIGGL